MSNHTRRPGLPGRRSAAVAAVLALTMLGGGALPALADSADLPPEAVPPAVAPPAAAETVGGITTVDDMQSIVTSMFSFGFVDVLDNDTGDGLVLIDVVGATGAERGTTSFLPDGGIDYQTPANFTGYEEFVYTVQDSAGTTAQGRVRFGAEEKPQTPDLVLNQTIADWGLTSNINQDSDFRLVETPEWRAKAINGLLPTWRDLGTETAGSTSSNYEVLVGGQSRYAEHPFREVTFVVENFSRMMTRAGWYGSATVPYQVESLLDSSLVSEGTITVNVAKPELDMQASTPYATAVAVPVLTQTWNVGYLSELVIAADNGVVTFVDNEAVYTPNPGFSGVDTFTVSALWDDPRYGGATTLPLDIDVTVTVGAPATVAEQTPYNTPKTVEVAGVGAESVTAVGQGAHGTVEIVGGKPVYTPNPGFVGTDSFTVEGTDAQGDPITVVVDITVAPPDAQQVQDTTPFETPKTIDLSGTDAASVASVGQGSNGTVEIIDGQVVYTPNPGFSGTDSFAVTVLDEFGTPITVTVDVTVGEQMTASAQTPYETPVTIDVLDQTGGTALTGTGQGSNGSAQIVDGELVYTPNPGFIGEDVVLVTVTDPNGQSVQVPVTVTVGGPEDLGLSTSTPFETPKTVDVLGESGADAIQSTGQGGNGTVTVDQDGTVVYTPNPGFVGEDEFTVTVIDEHGNPFDVVVTVTVDEPLLIGTGTGYETPKTVDVLGETGGQSITGTGPGENGTVTVDEDGTVVYTPNPGFIGEDEFPVSIIDDEGNPATVIVTVTVAGPEDEALSTSTPFETPKTIDVAGETGGTAVTGTGQGENGTVTANPDGTVTYTPNPGFIGEDQFTVTVTDEHGNPYDVVVDVTVGDVVETATETDYNTPVVVDPVAETDGGEITDARDGDNGTVVIDEDGNVVYTPNPGFVGEDEFTVIVTDEHGESTAVIVTVTVGGPEDQQTDTSTPFETPKTIDVLGESGGTGVTGTTDGTHGTVVVNPDGTVTYTPEPGFSGEDEFTVTVTDEFGTPVDVVVTITVGELVEIEDSTDYNTPKTIDVVGETDGGTITDSTDGDHGTVTVGPDGEVTYTPEPGFVGEDEFTVIVTDEDGNPTTVVVTVTVEGPAPVDVTDGTDYNTPKTIDVVGETDGGTITDATDGDHGTVVVGPDGEVTYTPEPGFVGEDEFTVIVTDEFGNEQEVTVTVTVDGPGATEIDTSTGYETSKEVDPIGDDGGTIGGTTDGSNGTVEIDGDRVIYTPNPGFVGEDEFTVTIVDEWGNEREVVVTVTVTPPATAEVGTQTPFETGKTIDILGETGAVEISSVTQGEHGSVEVVDGKVVYTPEPGFSGTDTFTVTVINADGTRTVVTVTVTVGEPAAAPTDNGTAAPGDTAKTGILATTGSSAGLLALLATGLGAVGVALSVATRRARRSAQH